MVMVECNNKHLIKVKSNPTRKGLVVMALISHGVARYAKEKLLDSADSYTTHVCSACGLFAQRLMRRDNKPYSTHQDVYHCPSCRNKTDIAKIRIPYAFKLLLQELTSMNVAPRIRVKKNQFAQ